MRIAVRLALALVATALCASAGARVAAHAATHGRGHSDEYTKAGAERAMSRAARMASRSANNNNVPLSERVSQYHTVALRTTTSDAQPFVGATSGPYPAALSFEFTLRKTGARYVVKVEQNMALTAPGYTEQSVGAFGTVTTLRRGQLTAADNCYYQGHAVRVDDAASAQQKTRLPYVALDICRAGAVHGSLYLDDGRWYSIEPAWNGQAGLQPATLLKLANTHYAGTQQQPKPLLLEALGDDTFVRSVHVVYANDDVQGDAANVHDFCGAHSHADAHRHARYTDERVYAPTTPSTSSFVSTEYQNVDLQRKRAAAEDDAPAAVHVQGIVLPNTTANAQLRYVELFVVNDYRRYQQMVDSTEVDALSIANRASVLYAQNSALSPPVNIVLVGQLTWQAADPYESQICLGSCSGTAFPCTQCGDAEIGVSQLLSLWNAWRSNPSHGLPYHDAGFLLSGHDFEGSLVGFAGIGVMCDYTQSGGIVQTLTYSVQFAGFTLTHELGHTLGMVHDVLTPCSPSGSIMTTTVSSTGSLPQFFSTCSLNSYKYYFGNISASQAAAYTSVTSGRVTCLDNRPANAYVMLPSQATCGNGYIELGETCDCGSADCMTLVGGAPADRCCNGTTCQLKAGAACSANSACCDATTCTPVAGPTSTSSTICRYADVRSGCDANQLCDGVNATCPGKSFKAEGSSCVNSIYNAEGYCDALDHCSQLGGRVERRWQSPVTSTVVVAVSVAVAVGAALFAVAARRHDQPAHAHAHAHAA